MQAPFEPDLIAATRMRDTAFKRVLQDLPIGTEVKLDAPYGDFTLHKTQSTPAVFIIGGIGVTPVRSMIAQATHDKTAHRITLLHASRTPADLPLRSDFEHLARKNPGDAPSIVNVLKRLYCPPAVGPPGSCPASPRSPEPWSPACGPPES